MKASSIRIAVAFTLPLLFLGAGSALVWIDTHNPIALALLLLGVTSASLAGYPMLPMMVAGLATISLALPYLLPPVLPGVQTLLWIGILWAAAALLPRTANQQIKALSTAMLQSPTGMLLTDLQGNIISANEQMAKLLQITRTNLNGQPLQQIMDSAVWETLQEQTTHFAEGHSLQIEFELGHHPNESWTAQAHARLVNDSKGVARYYVIEIADNSREQESKRKAENAFRQSRRILAQTNDLVLLISPKLHVTFANASAEEVLAREFGNPVGQPIYNCIKTAHRREFMKALETFTQTNRQETHLAEIELQGEQPLSVSMHIMRMGETHQDGYALIMSTSQAQQQLLADSKISQARFSQVFHGSPDAILILRAQDEVVIDFNEGFSRLLGFSREVGIGEVVSTLNFWKNTSERDAVIEQLRRDREVIGYETTLSHAQGALVHAEISLRYVEIDNELCVLCIGRDITKRISAEAALIESEEKFEKIFSRSPDGIIILRQSDGVITDANHVTLERSGYSRDEVIGKSILDTPLFLSDKPAATGDNAPASLHSLPDLASELARTGTLNNREINLTTKQGD
ncbi:MAG: PAS domain S-box protein, partial [Pseudomonadota bacterium]